MENIRERTEQLEIDYLSEFATKSRFTKGRKREIEQCNIRTDFQRDRDKIVHCKSFRRLKHKTQVFLSPFDDHFRTRLTHTLEVAQIARTISRALRLNEDLTEAISLGHDLGHTPFGHCGEGVLNRLVKGGFKHNEQSVRVVDVLEDLNLCQETIDGIYTHSWNHDIDDSIRAGMITENDLPKDCQEYFSSNKSKRLTKMITSIIENSMGKPEVSMGEECKEHTILLREWMFKNIYIDSPAKKEEKKTAIMVEELYKHYCKFLSDKVEPEKIDRIVTDYISGMTDQFATEKFKEIFIPQPMHSIVINDGAILKLINTVKY